MTNAFFFKQGLCIYVALLGLCSCVGFSLVVARGATLLVCRLLAAVTSVVEHGL